MGPSPCPGCVCVLPGGARQLPATHAHLGLAPWGTAATWAAPIGQAKSGRPVCRTSVLDLVTGRSADPHLPAAGGSWSAGLGAQVDGRRPHAFSGGVGNRSRGLEQDRPNFRGLPAPGRTTPGSALPLAPGWAVSPSVPGAAGCGPRAQLPGQGCLLCRELLRELHFVCRSARGRPQSRGAVWAEGPDAALGARLCQAGAHGGRRDCPPVPGMAGDSADGGRRAQPCREQPAHRHRCPPPRALGADATPRAGHQHGASAWGQGSAGPSPSKNRDGLR